MLINLWYVSIQPLGLYMLVNFFKLLPNTFKIDVLSRRYESRQKTTNEFDLFFMCVVNTIVGRSRKQKHNFFMCALIFCQ